MKYISYYLGFAIFAAVMIWVGSCTPATDSFSEYLQDGEQVYIGRPDTVIASSGIEKIRFNIIITSDPKINKGQIRTIDTKIIHDFDVVRKNAGVDTIIQDLALEEGEYRFIITLFDNSGNMSLDWEIPVTVLGPNYLLRLTPRALSSVSYTKGSEDDPSGATITLDKLQESLLYTVISYNKSNGDPAEVTAGPKDNSVFLEDFDAGSEFMLKSFFGPENPFDVFSSPVEITGELPACNSNASISISESSLDLGSVESRTDSTSSFELNSDDCLLGSLSVNVSGSSFLIGTDPAGPFSSSLSFDDVSTAQTIYVNYAPNDQVDSDHAGSISISATNVINTDVVQITGTEIGVPGGIQRHPVGMRSGVSDIFTDDLDVYFHGSSPGNLWDDAFRWPSANHSADNLPSPIGFFTVSLGDEFVIDEIGWAPRGDCCQDRSQNVYQYWGLPGDINPEDAITTTEFNGKPENKSAWQAEMQSKGWISLGQFSKDQSDIDNFNSSSELISDKITAINKVKYVRVVIISTLQGSNGTVNFSELDFKINLDE